LGVVWVAFPAFFDFETTWGPASTASASEALLRLLRAFGTLTLPR
jgi:hypothetical protein